MYAIKSGTRAMQLKEELTMIKKGNQTAQEYLHIVKALADEISLIDHPISDDDLTLYILNGLGSDFGEIAAPIRARERPLAFEELHDLLVGHDAYLRRLETTTQQLVASANYSNRRPASSFGGQNSKAHFKNRAVIQRVKISNFINQLHQEPLRVHSGAGHVLGAAGRVTTRIRRGHPSTVLFVFGDSHFALHQLNHQHQVVQ
ncbi:hypothetical protein HHK36_023864 [Tetracentron sinense]|uniref:Uncharacterized protein n=1 Tax=Tetracentron sinense TaxID=13715 RepID=A0A835D5S8_TETSI|nr:hypothetical protein HHK36_023864 [Tetracentron sinense]